MTATMRAQQLVAPRVFEMIEVPQPDAESLAEGEVLLRVLAGGVCGSDLPFWNGQKRGSAEPGPGFPMHEVVGEVRASKHPQIVVGRRVVGWAKSFDALSEFIIAHGDELFAYDSQLTPTEAIILQPLACAIYAVDQLSSPVGKHAAVLGFGGIGALFTSVLRERGAQRITVVDSIDRREEALHFGADDVVIADAREWADAVTDADRPDVVIEAVGHHDGLVAAAVRAIAHSGEIYAFGIPEPDEQGFSFTTFLRKNLTLKSGVTEERARMLAAAEEHFLRNRARVERVVTDVLALEDIGDGFSRAAAPAPGQLKIAVTITDAG